MNCPNCSKPVSDESVFCIHCGNCITPERFKNSQAVAEKEDLLKRLIGTLSSISHAKVEWNDTADRYVRVTERLNALCSNMESTEQIDNIKKKLSAFIDRCQSPEFHIAFVGTIKAGKSTLINALLGRNLASTSVTPETAVLTKFRHSDNGYVSVKFYNDAQWTQLWASVTKSNAEIFMKEFKTLKGDAAKASWVGHEDILENVSGDALEAEIEKWTSSKHVEHYFVREVEIGLPEFPYRRNVVFVDTPGLDDAVAYRSNVTREYIDRANAVFACAKADALTGPELNTIYRIFANTSYNTDKVYVIGTQWDSLNSPAEDWKKQKAEWIKYLTQSSGFKSEDVAERNIIHVASYLQNLCREYDKLTRDENKSLMSIAMKFDIMPTEIAESIETLMEKSNIQAIHSKIEQEIIGKTEEYLMTDITENYKELCDRIRRYFSEIISSQKDILITSEKETEVIKKSYEEELKKLESLEKNKSQLEDTLEVVRKDTKQRVDALYKELKGLTE